MNQIRHFSMFLRLMNSCTGKEIVSLAVNSALGKSPIYNQKILQQVVNA